MHTLNFPAYRFRLKSLGDKTLIFDGIRKKYVVLTPEEWVRQHVIRYLVTEKKYPASLISVETPHKYIRMNKRSDVLVYDRNGNTLMLVECKAPDVVITQKVFEQVSVYNMTTQAVCLVVTNGMQHFCLAAGAGAKPAHYLDRMPDYAELLEMRLNPD